MHGELGVVEMINKKYLSDNYLNSQFFFHHYDIFDNNRFQFHSNIDTQKSRHSSLLQNINIDFLVI